MKVSVTTPTNGPRKYPVMTGERGDDDGEGDGAGKGDNDGEGDGGWKGGVRVVSITMVTRIVGILIVRARMVNNKNNGYVLHL